MVMDIAVLFNPQHPTLGGVYGYAVMRQILDAFMASLPKVTSKEAADKVSV